MRSRKKGNEKERREGQGDDKEEEEGGGGPPPPHQPTANEMIHVSWRAERDRKGTNKGKNGAKLLPAR